MSDEEKKPRRKPKPEDLIIWLEVDDFLDKYFPGWRKKRHLWPKRE